MESQGMEQMNTVISDQLKYKKYELSHPQYKLSQLYPLSGLTSQNISTSGGQEIIFQLPNKCINLSKCFLNYNFIQNLNAAANNGFYNHMNPLSGIRQIQLYTQGGVYLCDVYHVNKYMDVVYYAETKQSDFLNNPALALANVSKYTMYAQPNNASGISIAQFNYSQRLITNPAGAIQDTSAAGTRSVQQLERNYIDVGIIAAGGGAAFDTAIQFPMKYLYNTIFSVDKDLYFGEVLNLRIVFESSTQVTFESTANVSFATIATNSLDYTDITFFCAIEKDLSICNNIMSKIQSSGLSIPIPFVYSYKQSLGASTSQTISIRLNRAHGKKLRRIYHAPYHTTETGVYAFMRDNLGGVKTVTNLYTMLNNDREQDFNIDTSKAQDHMILNTKIKGSCYVNVDSFQNKWFWVSDYTSSEPLWSKESQDVNLSSGIDLSSEQKWDIYMTTTNRAFNHYNFVVTEKELRIAPGQITVI